MIRTVWLGLAFLVVLAGVSSFRFAFGHFDHAYASVSARSEPESAAVTNSVQETLTEADRLPPLAYTASAPEPAPAPELAKADRLPVEVLPQAEPLPQAQAEPLPRLESLPRTPMASIRPRVADRQWHEPVSPAVRPAKSQNAKRKPAKKEVVAEKPEELVDPKACQTENFDAIRLAFNLPTGCHG